MIQACQLLTRPRTPRLHTRFCFFSRDFFVPSSFRPRRVPAGAARSDDFSRPPPRPEPDVGNVVRHILARARAMHATFATRRSLRIAASGRLKDPSYTHNAMAALRTFVKEALRASSSSVSSSSTTSAASSSARRLFSSSAKSNVHHLPKLPERIKDGCMPLLSKSTVEMLWNEHQSGLLEKLNAEVAGELEERQGMADQLARPT